MKQISNFILLAALLSATTAEAKWSRIPIIKERPVDLAVAGAYSSASLDSSSGFGQVDALLTDDITKPATVSNGKSFAVINLGKPVLISQASFVNDGIEGKAVLSASADKSGWAVLEEKVFSAADREVAFKFAGMQAKFIKLEFVLSRGGQIRNLLFFGGQTDRGYAVKQSKDGKEGKPMDLLKGLGGARVIYAAPRPANGTDTAVLYNKFSFPESDEKYRTIIYDLGQLRIMNEFASVHSPRPVRFEVFAFDNLPEKEDWRGRLAFDPSEFDNSNPVAVAEDTLGTGSLKAMPAKQVKTRYLALRWEPEFNPPDFSCEASGSGMVLNIMTTNTVTVTNPDGSTSVITVQVGDAAGAGAATSGISPDNAAQAVSAGMAASSDTTTIVTQTFAPGVDPAAPGATPTSTSTQTGTSVVTVAVQPNGTVVTTSESTTTDPASGNQVSTTITESKAPDGSTTTNVTTTTTDPTGSTPPVTQTNVNTGAAGNNSQTSTVSTSSDGNLGGGSTPAPSSGGSQSAGTVITTGANSP